MKTSRWPSLNLFSPAARRSEGPAGRTLDRLLRRLGPSWRASPVRRAVQTAALGLYLWLFFYAAFPGGHVLDPGSLSARPRVPLDLFLWLDPLAGPAAALAARAFHVALWGAAATAGLCILLPRAFCGWLCPLGTLIDAFDWLIGRRVRRGRTRPPRPAMRLRYGVLAAVVVAAALGVLLAAVVSPIPLLTRGLLLTAGRVQGGLARGWQSLGPMDETAWAAAALLVAVLLGGLLGARFWCRHVCPGGAMLSLVGGLRLFERTVGDGCIQCGRCVEACEFGAVADDFSTRHDACTSCQTCGGVCPTGAIGFTVRLAAGPKAADAPQAGDAPQTAGPRTSRRALLAAVAGGTAVAVASRWALGSAGAAPNLLRPPGSVAEEAFLDLCVRCGLCMQVCPGPVLHSAGASAGIEALWTPVVVPSVAGCHPDCNLCTQVCPTGAIAPLTLAAKRRARIGTAVVDRQTCLAHAGRRECNLCYEECRAAGYDAIEMRTIRLEIGEIPEGTFSEAELAEMSRIRAPFVRPHACVGCGLCEFRCAARWARAEKLLPRSAITVEPGPVAPTRARRRQRRGRGP